jgi:hypothetical protein
MLIPQPPTAIVETIATPRMPERREDNVRALTIRRVGS